MDKVRLGFIGFGGVDRGFGRGKGLIKMILAHMPDVQITALCEKHDDRLQMGKQVVEEMGGYTPFVTADYRELIARPDVDAVICATSWDMHVPICIECMEAGKPVGLEVGGAFSIDQCWDLVKTHERTGVQLMLLENVCYRKDVLTALKMVKEGLFGELIYCSAGYHHDCRDEVALGHIRQHGRHNNFKHRNADLYPTHDLGPLAKLLDINRGNRMISLTSMASKARGLNDYILRNKGADFDNAHTHFAQGDVVTTCIKCANGETILLTHDITLPQPSTMRWLVKGTRGVWDDAYGIYLDEPYPGVGYNPQYTPMEDMYKDHLHPLWKNYDAVGGHGGIDFLTISAFVESVKNNTEPPIDVYDAAAWRSITILSEYSIACGSAPVPIPDFTNGKWLNRKPAPVSKYSLSAVHDE